MKKSKYLLFAGVACLLATACQKDRDSLVDITLDKFVMGDTQFKSSDDSKVALQYSSNKLIYEVGDVIKVNGKTYTLSKTGEVWYANGPEQTANQFYCAYADGVESTLSYNSSNNTYQFSLTPSTTSNKVLLGGVTENNVLTLHPACAIIRLPLNDSYTNVKVGFETSAVLKAGTMTITSEGVTLSGSTYMLGVDVNGDDADFLKMEYTTDEGGYWYVAVPVSNTVSTKLYFYWKNSGGTEVRNVTSGQVTLAKGWVYTAGTSRQTPFNAYGIGNHRFKVSDSQFVRFSAGNLQCIREYDPLTYARTNKWRFAEHQYDMIQSGNNNISESNTSTWIDLFGWGTSGDNTGRTSGIAYEPYETSGTFGFADVTANIAGTRADWGVGNSNNIYYGSTISRVAWRTLTDAEWNYLITKSGCCGYATIGNVYHGVVLIPDDPSDPWSIPSGLSFNSSKSSYNDNEYSLSDWDKMEMAGAIFLPAAGIRASNVTSQYNSEGYYWSTSNSGSSENAHKTKAYCLKFTGNSINTAQEEFRSRGFSVRLVMNN